MEELNFDLAVKEVPVKLTFPKDGLEQGMGYSGGPHDFILREASQGDAKVYKNALLNGVPVQLNEEGAPQVSGSRDLGGLPALAISLCLWDPTGKRPTVAQIDKWPARVTSALAKTATKISELDEKSDRKKAQEEVKNEQSATAQSSSCASASGSSPPSS